MEVAKISSKGQITISVSVRNKLKLKTGEKINRKSPDCSVRLCNRGTSPGNRTQISGKKKIP